MLKVKNKKAKRLMKNFSIDELCQSRTAKERNIPNTPSAGVKMNLEALVDNILDPLREAFGRPITVKSGYRSTLLNDMIGGAKGSQHTRGEAADITGGTKEQNRWLFEYIRRNLPYDQLIDEKNYSWIHVSYKREGTNRQQVLKL